MWRCARRALTRRGGGCLRSLEGDDDPLVVLALLRCIAVDHNGEAAEGEGGDGHLMIFEGV